MKKASTIRTIAAIVMICGSMCALCSMTPNPQTSLVGKVYKNPNVMKSMMDKAMDGVTTSTDSVVRDAISKKEKELGRKLTESERTKLNEEVDKDLKTVKALTGSMKMSISVTFKDEKTLIAAQKTSIDDNALKMAGVSWAKRKLMKAAIAMAPEEEKCTYERKGNLIIYTSDGEKDTLTLSNDGTKLTGKIEGKETYVMTLQK